jgi:pimeloyl-ACP methyl ester carboxylesterase
MPKLNSNGLELEYDTFGDRDASPLLLIMGLGTQMISWDEAFCAELAERGLFVVRYDNRDIGLSTKLDSAGVPNMAELLPKAIAGERVDVPYQLGDMAADAVGVLDALEIGRAHVVGASMGGMIAQCMAIDAPERVRSLTSIMSTTGRRDLTPPRPEAIQRLMMPPAADSDAYATNMLETRRIIGSTGFPLDEEQVRAFAQRAYARGHHPAGAARQSAAIFFSEPRGEALSGLDVPALVIHGDADPLVPIEGGLDTHACIPDCELLVITGMGHDLPRGAWPPIIDAISKLTTEAA